MRSNQSAESQNQATDLNTLTHPLVLFSIALLLINDHVLKVYSPSWLTGKLSDFTGLFFFPILLSAILNIIWKPINFKQHHLTMAAFGFTAFWFCLTKTLPFFSHLTENILSGLLSVPTKIICDPTDLIALIMLLPAWKLRTINEKLPSTKNTKLSYLALCIASIATLATSPGISIRVSQLTVYENRIYANFTYDDKIFYSFDSGKTWAEVKSNLPTQVTDNFEKSRKLPVTACLPDSPNICYRTGQAEIVQSLDGGKTWSTSWNIPLVQRRFMGYSDPYMDLGPNDLIFLEQDNKQVLIAAMGSEGVLIKTDDGPWESIEVNGLGPIIYKDANLIDAIGIVGQEIIIISLIALFLLLINILVNIKSADKNKGFTWLKIAMMACGISVIGWAFSIFIVSSKFFPLVILASLLRQLSSIIFPVSMLFIIVLSFQQLITNLSKQGIGGLIVLMLIWLFSCALYLFWVYDMIHETRPIFITVIILNMGYLIWLLWRFLIRIEQRLAKNS